MQDLASGPVDVPLGHPRGDASPCALRCLASKGFCVLELDWSEEFHEGVFKDVRALAREGRLRKPPRLVADGLLGEAGSARVCELPAQEGEEEGGAAGGGESVGEALAAADRHMSEVGIDLIECGADLAGRMQAVVHETGPPGLEEPELTAERAAYWLANFARGKLMVLLFLGPGRGTLELRVHGEDDSDPYEISTRRGLMVLLRAPLLVCEHRGQETSYVLGCFLVGEQQQWFKRQKVSDLPPAARALDRWLMEGMEALKQKVDPEEETALRPAIPRDVQRLMNRLFLKGERTAIRGSSCKLANTMGLDTFHRALFIGLDGVIEVPQVRWSHEDYYDADAEGYRRGKVCCMHMGFVPDIQMFDNKLFMISASEAQRMDPCERQLLELGYGAVASAGLKKKDLMNSDCGVFVAWTSDTAVIEDRGMGANRLNFCLGCKGPSMACDVDHASSLVAVKVCSAELGRACSQGMALGCQIHTSPRAWLSHAATGVLSSAGRVLAFGAGADGFVRADGMAGVYMRKLAQRVDGEEVVEEGMPLLGVLQAAVCRSQGRAASLRALDGPCLQEVVAESVRIAKISPLDIDFVECDAKALPLHDAVEVHSAHRAVRPQDVSGGRPPEHVALGAVKTSVGNTYFSAALVSLLRALAGGLYGVTAPLQHLRQISPWIDGEASEHPFGMLTEALPTLTDTAFAGITALGWGGTLAHAVVWARVDQERVRWGSADRVEDLYFWPGGGGFLSREEVPSRAYTIVGTWSCWSDPQEMQVEDDGVYGYTVTLGENCWELFQIWLDGDERQVLHPGRPKAPKSTAVRGPGAVGVCLNWLIDGRPYDEGDGGVFYEGEGHPGYGYDGGGGAGGYEPEAAAQAGGASSPWAAEEEDEALPSWVRRSPDEGWPGAQYRVRLRVAGKWRGVDWELVSEPLADGAAPAEHSEAVLGRYFLTGSWNCWGFQEMLPVPGALGVYSGEVLVCAVGGEDFQIVRNEDWHQIIYPVQGEVAGPDDAGHGLYWHLSGQVGDLVRVEFQRVRDERGRELLGVSWRRARALRPEELDRAQLQEAQRPRFFVVGSWDGYKSRTEMLEDCEGYAADVEVADGQAQVSFQVLLNGCWGAILHPGIPDAGPNEHVLLGPEPNVLDCSWAIRRPATAEALSADAGLPLRYRVRLHLGPDGRPRGVTWSQAA